MDKKLIQDLKNAWRNTNSATTGFLQSIPSDKVSDKPFERRFTNYAWEFACLIRTRLCYLREFKTGIQNFADGDEVPNKDELAKESKAKMLELISETSNTMLDELQTIESSNDQDFDSRLLQLVTRTMWLLQHERIHQGKLMLYHAKAGYQIPESFKKTWGESNFKL